MNQEQWSEVTLIEVDEKVTSTPWVKTLVTQNIQHKRSREKTQLATELVKEYYILQKKSKTVLLLSSRNKPLEIIDLVDLEDVSLERTTDPKISSTSSTPSST